MSKQANEELREVVVKIWYRAYNAGMRVARRGGDDGSQLEDVDQIMKLIESAKEEALPDYYVKCKGADGMTITVEGKEAFDFFKQAITEEAALEAQDSARESHIGRLRVLRAWVVNHQPVFDTGERMAQFTLGEINNEIKIVERWRAEQSTLKDKHKGIS